MLRDCGLPQVSSRSPSPDSPISVGPRAQRLAEASHLRKAARDERRMRAGPELAALDDAGRDRQHVLDRAAELHAHHVARPVEPQRARAERDGQRLAQRLVGGGQRQRRGQPARHVGGKARTRQHGEPRLRQCLAQHLAEQLAGRLLEPLGADDDRLAPRQVPSQLCAHRAHMLRRRHHQHDVLRGDPSEIGRRLQPGVQRHVRQEHRIGMRPVDVGDHLRLARPQQRIAARERERLRQRRPPRPAADDADALDCHQCAPTCPPGLGRQPESRDPATSGARGPGSRIALARRPG